MFFKLYGANTLLCEACITGDDRQGETVGAVQTEPGRVVKCSRCGVEKRSKVTDKYVESRASGYLDVSHDDYRVYY